MKRNGARNRRRRQKGQPSLAASRSISPSPSHASTARRDATPSPPPKPVESEPVPVPPPRGGSIHSPSSSDPSVACGSHSCSSARLRTQGNVLYKQVLSGAFCLALRRVKLARARGLYKQALDASLTVDEKASSYKNLGMLLWLSCKEELDHLLAQGGNFQSSKTSGTLLLCKSYLIDAVSALSKALENGMIEKPRPWLDHLHSVFLSMVQWASDHSASLSISHAPLLQYVSEAFDSAALPSSVKLISFKTYAETLFHEALTSSFLGDEINYKGCHRLLEFSLVPLRKAPSPSLSNRLRDENDNENLLRDIKDLEQSINIQLCICEAMQAVALGDECLPQSVLKGESGIEKAMESLDLYRQASILTRERHMETEAIAMSRIGKVYSDLLCMPEVSHKYHFQAVRLALTVMSPSLERSEWYQYSLGKVKKHQEEVVAKEEEENKRDRESALKRLESKLAALSKESEKGAEALLKYLYTEHPHPDITKNIVPQVGTKSETKASLKKAILHYHPDTNVRHGDDWKVLCEEICKHLNNKYGCFKGV